MARKPARNGSDRGRRRGLAAVTGRGPVLAAALALVLGSGLARRAAAADLDEIRARWSLRVGLPAAEAAPFLVVEADGRLGGLEGELVQDLARRLGVRLETVRVARTAGELVTQVTEGRVDLAIGRLPDSLAWAQSVRFTNPYVTLYELRLIDRLAATRAGGVEALLSGGAVRIVALEANPVLAGLRAEFGPGRVIEVPSWRAAVAEVSAGRAVAVSGDDVALGRWLGEHPEAGLHLEARVLPQRALTLAMAVHWRAENLQAWLNLYLDKCVSDETLRKLRRKHLGEARMRWEK
jgi:ABC-type amino acid transport substrate-binding protein